MKLSTSGLGQQDHEGGREGGDNKCLNSELWHACAGPLVSLPAPGTRVVYFPQGHSEHVAATTNKEIDRHMPNYPSLQPQLFCQLHNVTMHADVETDEVYAQLTLQPLTPEEQKDTFLPMEFGIPSRQPTNYFCKTLTASDTSTHGGFSVPRRAAEKVFPPLDFSQQPPAQELVARDLHDVDWKFRHIFRGQPKRHLLTTGWSVFVSAKRLVAGDSVLFIWNEKNQLLLGIRRATRPQSVMPSSVLTSDSMHIGLLAAAAHASSTNSCFTVLYNPRASPSEFVIPLSKFIKAVYQTRISVGMRFRMHFETEESSVKRYMGTVTGISDLDSVRWPNSHWRSIKVGWDESMAGERQPRVSLWEIEPLTSFPIYPSLFPFRMKRPWFPGALSMHGNIDNEGANSLMWLRGRITEQGLQSMNIPTVSMFPWMQQRVDASTGIDHNQQFNAMLTGGFPNAECGDASKQHMMQFQQPFQYIQQSSSHNPLVQMLQQPIHHNVVPTNSQVPTENMSQHLIQQPFNNQTEEQIQQQQHTYHNTLKIQNEQVDQRQPLTESSSSFPTTDLLDSTNKFSPSVIPRENVLGSLYPEGRGNFLSLMRAGHSAISEQLSQESWAPKVADPQVNDYANSMSIPQCPGKDITMEPGNFSLNSQNSTQFDVNRESSPLILPTTLSSFPTYLNDIGASTMPLEDSGDQSLYSSVQDSSELLHGAGQVDAPTATRTFVKVYKSGSVGRSLDISQFSSYHELREGLAHMFGIEVKLDDPFRSGWQLVFVDRENDILLLGDDPWEAFVNSVWYIKILSPEDMHKMGEQAVGQRMNSSDNEVHDLSGLPAYASFEY